MAELQGGVHNIACLRVEPDSKVNRAEVLRWQAANDEFERCWPWIAKAVERHGGTHTNEHVWAEIARGRAHLLSLPNAAIVGNVINYPTGLKRGNAWLAGARSGSLGDILGAVPLMEAWAKSQGCQQGSMYARRGWLGPLQELGYREMAVFIVKDFD